MTIIHELGNPMLILLRKRIRIKWIFPFAPVGNTKVTGPTNSGIYIYIGIYMDILGHVVLGYSSLC